MFNTVKGFHRFARSQGALNVDPFEGIKGIKRPESTPNPPTDEEVERLVEGARGAPRRQAVIALLLNGLRASEVCDLTEPDLRHEAEYGRFLNVVGKGGRQRFVPLIPEAYDALLLFWNTRQAPEKWLVHGWDGKKLTRRQVEYDVYKAAEYAGVSDMHPHRLRHHYATRLIRAGVSVLHLQKLLGHARADTTQGYVSLLIGDLVEAAKLDPRNKRPEGLRLLEAM